MMLSSKLFENLVANFPAIFSQFDCRVKQFESVVSSEGRKPKYDTTVFVTGKLWIKIEETGLKYMDIQDPSTGICIYSRDNLVDCEGTWNFHGSYDYNTDVISGVVLSIARQNKVLHLRK